MTGENSAAPGTPQTAMKAHVGAGIGGLAASGVTLLLFWAGSSLGFTPPPIEEAQNAFRDVVVAAGVGITTAVPAWFAIWRTRNKPLPPT